jgi:hypothetical protein
MDRAPALRPARRRRRVADAQARGGTADLHPKPLTFRQIEACGCKRERRTQLEVRAGGRALRRHASEQREVRPPGFQVRRKSHLARRRRQRLHQLKTRGRYARCGRGQNPRPAPQRQSIELQLECRRLDFPGAYAQRRLLRLTDRAQKAERHMPISLRQRPARNRAECRRRGLHQLRTPRVLRPEREEQPPQTDPLAPAAAMTSPSAVATAARRIASRSPAKCCC